MEYLSTKTYLIVTGHAAFTVTGVYQDGSEAYAVRKETGGQVLECTNGMYPELGATITRASVGFGCCEGDGCTCQSCEHWRAAHS